MQARRALGVAAFVVVLAAALAGGAGAHQVIPAAERSHSQAPTSHRTGRPHPAAAQIAVRYLGVPYVWGGASPSGFDDAGLVMYVYRQLGISLPHYTVSQWGLTKPISRAKAQPGDLVFFFGHRHVGIYLGGGQMVDAPHTGAVVRVESVHGFGSIDGFRRVR